MNRRENYIRTLEFGHPEWIPCTVGLSPHAWKVHGGDLEQVVLSHPRLFPDYCAGDYRARSGQMPAAYREGERYRDNWGCLWDNIEEGLEGQVVEHPLADWSALDSYAPPDVARWSERGPMDWDEVRQRIETQRGRDELTVGNGERLFDRLYFLRGFDNLMMDFASGDANLPRLIEMLTEHECRLVDQWLAIGVDAIGFHTDIGTQKALMISPEAFREYVKPMYAQIFHRCRAAGTHVLLSSDGCLVEIVDDLVECGVSSHDPQLRASTLEGIERAYKGKLCIDLDLDRQSFPFLSPAGVREQIRESVDRLALPEGGLMIKASVTAGDVPVANVEAICAALEQFCLP